MASKTREQKFIHEFTAPYKFRSDKTGEIEIGNRRVGIRPHTQCNKFPHLVLVCEYVKDCLGWGWKKSYYFDKKQNALFRIYNMRYIEPGNMTSAFILHYLQDYFAPQAATADDDSQPELPENPEIAISATDNDSVLASQPAAVASTESETATNPNDDLPTRIVRAKDSHTIQSILRSLNPTQLKAFAVDENINLPAKLSKSAVIAKLADSISARLAKLANGEDISSTNMWGLPSTLNSPITRAFYESRITNNQKRLIPLPHGTRDKNEWDNVMRKNVRMCLDCDNSDDLRDLLNTASTWDLLARTADECGVRFAPNASRSEIINATVIAHAKYKATLKRKSDILAVSQPDALYMDDSFSDAPGDNSECARNQDFPVDILDSMPADNPGFTIVPSEHIERPQYATYTELIIDECPYTTVYACDIPENHNSAAAVVPHVNPITAATMRLASNLAALLFVVCKIIIPLMFMRKKDLKKANTDTFLFTVGYKYVALFHDKRQFITISDRHTDKYGFTWLSFYDEDNISYNARVKLRDDGYTELLDFKELERTCYAFEGFKPIKESNRVKYIKFEVGRSYTAKRDSFGEHREFHITVLERFSAVSCENVKSKDKIICLKVCATDSKQQNKTVTGWIHAYVNRDILAEEFTRLPNLILRADQPDPVQEIHAETREITPKSRKPESAPASVPADIEHKLIDTKELHFSEKCKALDHNAAVITSCMFPEAVISLLMSISAKAVIQLGFHMGLFIAKPKGSKKAIAELFAQRLIARRDIHANVRTKPANTDAKNTPDVPDGVKFFVGARRQICFKFED